MLIRTFLRGLVVQQLREYFNGTVEVHETRSLPLVTDRLPAIIVPTPGERKASLGVNNKISYNTTVVVDVVIRATGGDELLTQAKLEELAEGVEHATFGNQAVLDPLNMIEAADVSVSINTEGGKPLGEVRMRLMLEMFEQFDPTHPVPLTDIHATVTDQAGDAVNHTLATFDVALPQEPPCS